MKNKRPPFYLLVLCIFVFSVITDCAYAQENIPSQTGLKGGVAISHFRNLGRESSSVTGFEVGLYKNYLVSSRFSLQPELMYVQKGGIIMQKNQTVGLHLEYVEVPLLAQYHPKMKGLRPRLFGGIDPALKLVAYSDVKLGDNTNGSLAPDKWADHVNNFDLNLVAGVGNDFLLGGRTIGLEIRYSYGLTQAFDGSVPSSAKNSTLSILAGFTF